jgi:predicted transposase YbfD/YdcC
MCWEAESLQNAIRAYWGIENKLHYNLDKQYQEDNIRIKSTNLAANLSIVRRTALAVLTQKCGKNIKTAQQAIFNKPEKIVQLLE